MSIPRYYECVQLDMCSVLRSRDWLHQYIDVWAWCGRRVKGAGISLIHVFPRVRSTAGCWSGVGILLSRFPVSVIQVVVEVRLGRNSLCSSGLGGVRCAYRQDA